LVNLMLAERGWIKKHIRGWLLTDSGKQLGGQQHASEQSGIPFVTWPETLLGNKFLLRAVAQLKGDASVAQLPTLDGRQVTNTAGRMVSNWLYVAGVSYAQDYELDAGDSPLRASFYIPEIPLCIDCWPANAQAANLSHQLEKQAQYRQHKISFIELYEADLEQLDNLLARKLLSYGLAIY